MADNNSDNLYTINDFGVVFDRTKNLHYIESKTDKPLPKIFEDAHFTRFQYADTAINTFISNQKVSKSK